MGSGFSSRDLGPRPPLLRGPQRQSALQVNHPRRLCGHGSHTRLEHRAEPVGDQPRPLRSDLWPGWCDHDPYAVALRHRVNGVLIGAEINAVLAHMSEERKDTKIVQPQGSGNQSGTRPKNTAM